MVSSLMSIKPNETEIIGQWVNKNGGLVANAAAKRVYYLIENELTELGRSDDGWPVLYLDKADGRYWELKYPDSEKHGGGAPCLEVLNNDDADAKFNDGAWVKS